MNVSNYIETGCRFGKKNLKGKNTIKELIMQVITLYTLSKIMTYTRGIKL